MSFDPLYLFVFAGLFTPGPNVVLLIASGIRFGFRASLPHIIGVASGVGVTAGLTGLGIAAALLAQPALALALRIAAATWILYLAWKLFRAIRKPDPSREDKPFTFAQAVLFQWVNPKVWAVAVAAAAGFGMGGTPIQEAVRLASAFAGINLFVCIFYAGLGGFLNVHLKNERSYRLLMTVLAGLMALSALLIFL